MPIPLEIDDVEKLDEGVRSLYVREGDEGPYRLDVEGLPDVKGLKSALEKERTTVKDLKKQHNEFAKQWEGFDRADVDDLIARRAELEKHSPDKIKEQIEQRVNQNDEAWKDKYSQLEQKNQQLFGELAQHRVRDKLMVVGSKAGIAETAMEDFLARGERIFRMTQDGDVKPLDSKGEVRYGKDGVEPLTMDEFVKGLQDEAPHLFKASSGGGASNDGGGRGHGTVRAKSDFKTTKEKSDYIAENGMEKYLQLPATR